MSNIIPLPLPSSANDEKQLDDFLEASISDLYTILLDGIKVEIPFSSAKEAEAFRASVFAYKRRQDKVMIGIGMITEDERVAFSFKYSLQDKKATLRFIAKKSSKKFQFKIVEDDDGNSDD